LKSVTLIGSSSGRNAGDAALMSSIMAAVDRACGVPLRYEIPTIRPRYVRENYPNRPLPIPTLPWNLSIKMLGLPTLRSILRTDLTLIFDAILFDRALYNPLFNFLSTLYLLLPLARRRGKRMAFYNVGAGPITTAAGRRMLCRVADLMDFIAVRDEDSRGILREAGTRNPRVGVAADAAVNAEACDDETARAILRRAGLDPSAEIVALNVNTYLGSWSGSAGGSASRRAFVQTYVRAMNRALEGINAQVAVVATQHADVPLSRDVAAGLSASRPVGLVTNVDCNHAAIKGVLARVSMLFAMRLHSLILASSSLTPVAGLAYQPKLRHYFDVLGMPDLCMGFDAFSEDALARHVRRAWDGRAAQRERLRLVMPHLKEKALRTADLVGCLHRNEDVDAAFSRIFPPDERQK
jgi:polysaccharide pyruvyl transferase WcaK-like protein